MRCGEWSRLWIERDEGKCVGFGLFDADARATCEIVIRIAAVPAEFVLLAIELFLVGERATLLA